MVFAIFYIPIFVVFALNLLSWMASHVYYVSLTHAVSASMKGALTDRLLLALDADHNNRVDRLEVRAAIGKEWGAVEESGGKERERACVCVCGE